MVVGYSNNTEMMNFLIFSKLLKIVIQNITFLKIFSISFVKDDWFYYFKKVHKIKISFIHPHAAVDWTFSLDFFSLNLLNIIVLKENRNVFVLEKLSPLPLSPQVTVWSGAEIITASNIIFLVNLEPNFFCFNTKHAVVVNQTSYWCRNQNARIFW